MTTLYVGVNENGNGDGSSAANAKSIADAAGSYDAVVIVGNQITVSAVDLNRLAALAPNGSVDATSVKTLTGLVADMTQSYQSALTGRINGLGNESLILSDTTVAADDLNSLDLRTGGTINASSVTELTGSAAAITATYRSSGISGLGNETVTLTDTALAADVLNGLDGRTTGLINAQSVGTLSGTAYDLAKTFTSDGIQGLGNANLTLSNTTLASADLNRLIMLDGQTAGTIDAGSVTAMAGSASALATAYGSNGISGLGNEALTVADTTLAAALLNTLDAATTGSINASSVLTMTGSVSDIATAYRSAGITGLGNESVILSDASLSSDGLTTLNALDLFTAKKIDAASVLSLTGSAAALNTAYSSAGITGLGNENVTITDKSLAASVLLSLDGETSGVVDASSVNALTGSASELVKAYTSSGITGLGNEDLTIDGASVTAADLNSLDGFTTGQINATSVSALTGSAAALQSAFASGQIAGLGHEALTLNDTSLAARDLNALDRATTGLIDAGSAKTMTGSVAQLATAYRSKGVSGLGDEAVTLSDTKLDATGLKNLNTLDLRTTGTINAGSITGLTGSAAQLASAYGSTGITGLGNEKVKLTDKTLNAALLNTLDGKTSGQINASSVTTLKGAAADILQAHQSAGIAGLGKEKVVLTNIVLSAADMHNFSLLGSVPLGHTDFGSVKSLSGTAADLLSAFNDLKPYDVTGLGHKPVTLTNTTLTAADLHALESLQDFTNGKIDAGSVTSLNGSAAGLLSAYQVALHDTAITGLGNEAVTLSDTTLSAADLNGLDSLTSGLVNASSALVMTGTVSDLAKSYLSGGIAGLGNEDVTLSDRSLDAGGLSDLNTLDQRTSGTINAGSVTTLEGSASALETAYASTGIVGLGNETLTLADKTLAASLLNTLDSQTSGSIDAKSVTTLTGSAADVAKALGSDEITGLSKASVDVIGTNLADLMSGTANDDSLNGGAGNDTLDGGRGNDTLIGGVGTDSLVGGLGNDSIFGGDGADVLVGGAGADTLSGDAGADHFVFATTDESSGVKHDVIADFTSGFDKIDLHLIDANTTVADDQAFAFGDANPTAFGIWFANGSVYADVTGDKVADFEVALQGVSSVVASDFIL